MEATDKQIKAFTKEILEVIEAYVKIDPNLAFWTENLVQICCAFAFEMEGKDAGRATLIGFIDNMYKIAE